MARCAPLEKYQVGQFHQYRGKKNRRIVTEPAAGDLYNLET